MSAATRQADLVLDWCLLRSAPEDLEHIDITAIWRSERPVVV